MRRNPHRPGLLAHLLAGALTGGSIALLVETPFHDPGVIAGLLLAGLGAIVGAVEWHRTQGASEDADLGGRR